MIDARLQLASAGMHPERVRGLLESYGPEGTLRRVRDGAIKVSPRIRAAVEVPAQQRRRQQLDAAGIGVVFNGASGYPAALAGMPDAPDLLFVRGSLPEAPSVAVVGSRRCTAYGRRIADQYGRAIAEAGWLLISGLARGIDGAAHRGTVAAGGRGVAVLGSGIDVMYPREHADLARDLIAGGGAVISEAPPGTPPEAWRFPPRNRIISGLADVIIVVEATVKGGALITAESALRQGKHVLAVPGDITRASSAGCNLLIRDGAFPVHDVEDLIESLELILGPARPAVEAIPRDLDPEEEWVVALVRAGSADIDSLVAATGNSTGSLLAVLGRLELAGVVATDGPGRYLAR